jgi:hypothetical protein
VIAVTLDKTMKVISKMIMIMIMIMIL